MRGNICDLFRSWRWCLLMSLSAPDIWSAHLPLLEHIHNIVFLSFKYYRQIALCAFQLVSCLDEKLLRGRSKRGTFLFHSWIVNHINLLSYRHCGVCRDLCGFCCMALLTWDLILYINSYLMVLRITWMDYGHGLRRILWFCCDFGCVSVYFYLL